MQTGIPPELNLVGPQGQFPKVALVDPTTSGYLFFALEIDHRLPFAYFLESNRKKTAISALKDIAESLRQRTDVHDATVFKTLIAPPGQGALLKHRPDIKIARYDVVLLAEFATPEAAHAYRVSNEWTQIETDASRDVKEHLTITATNLRAIGAVDHQKQGVFLFNYFVSDSLAQNLGIWEYTAGWFTDQTGLDNSTLLHPDDASPVDYTVINHCRWDGLWDILPSLLFKKSFRSFVLKNFEANATAPIPILYRLA